MFRNEFDPRTTLFDKDLFFLYNNVMTDSQIKRAMVILQHRDGDLCQNCKAAQGDILDCKNLQKERSLDNLWMICSICYIARYGINYRRNSRSYCFRMHARMPARWNKTMRKKIRKRDGNHCHWCGVIFGGSIRSTLDHVIPVCSGGTNDYENLRLSCAKCNQKRAL